jgi:hypothetical protein
MHDIGFSIYTDAAESSTSRHQSTSASSITEAASTERPSAEIDAGADAEEDKENVRPTMVAPLAPPYLASPGPSRPRSRLRESAINLDHDSPIASPKGTPKKSGLVAAGDGIDEEEELLRIKATRSGRRSSPRRAVVGRI